MSRSLSQFDAKQTSSEDCSPIVWAYIEMIIWRFAIQFGERRRQSKKRKEKMKLENINLKELRSENLPKFDNCPCELCDDGCFDRNKLEHNPSCKRKLIVKKSETFSKLRKCPLTHYQMTFKSFLDPTGKGEDHRRELCPPPADNEIPISFANHPMSGLTAQREHFQAPRPTGVVKPAKPSVRKTEQNSIELGFLLSRTIWFWIELRQCKLRLNTRPNSSRNQWQKSNSKNYRIQTTNQSFLFVFCVFFSCFRFDSFQFENHKSGRNRFVRNDNSIAFQTLEIFGGSSFRWDADDRRFVFSFLFFLLSFFSQRANAMTTPTTISF